MTLAELLGEDPTGYLIDAGETLHTVGAVAHTGGEPGVFFWSTMFPVDQHHTHTVQYHRYEIFYDRDFALYGKGGRVLAYGAPAVEWPKLDFEEWRLERVRWQEWLEDPKNSEAFRFLLENENPIGAPA